MHLQRIMSLSRKAIDEFNLINENDKIAVGVSGGKDSLTVFLALNGLKRFYPKKFDIVPVSINTGFDNVDYTGLKKFFDSYGYDLDVLDTDIKQVVFDEMKSESPCAICSKMRKGALIDHIKELGINKLCFGHHKDDLIETFLMSTLYSGESTTFLPKHYLDKNEVYIIRPMIYIDERDIIGFANKENLPVIKSNCPVDQKTKREFVKNLIRDLEKENKYVKDSLFSVCMNYIKTNIGKMSVSN